MFHFRNNWTCALLLVASVCGSMTGTGFAIEQDAMTAAALTRYNQLAASQNWNLYLNRYLNTGAGSTPRYDARHLAFGHAVLTQPRLSRFIADGNLADLEYLLSTMTTVNANRADRLVPPLLDEQRNRYSPAWVSFNVSQGAQAKQHAWFGHAGLTVHPAAQAAAIVKNDPALNAVYGVQADAILTDIIQTLDSFDIEYHVDANGGGYYTDPYFQFYSGVSILPFNLQNMAGPAYIALWQATGEERFHQRAVEMATRMKNELVAVGDRYRWRYGVHRPANSAEDVAHAGFNADFMVKAYEAGIVFNDTDIQRLANTMKFMYVPDQGFTTNIDGTGGLDVGSSDEVARWLQLTKYDASLRELVYPFFNTHWTSGSGPTRLQAAAYYVESGKVYEKLAAHTDSFDQLQLDARWTRPVSQPITHTWIADMRGTRFRVNDVRATGVSNQWVDIRRRQHLAAEDQWEVMLAFSWRSTKDGKVDEAAMQRFRLELYDDNDLLIAQVGLNDTLLDDFGRREALLGGESFLDPLGSLSDSGDAVLRVISDATLGKTWLLWDAQLLLTVDEAWNLGAADVVFGAYLSGASHFGTLWLDEFYVGSIVSPVPEPGAAAGLILGCPLLLRRRRPSRNAHSR